MTIYFQHVGEQGGTRDFPRTIGTREKGLVNFSWHDIEDYLDELDPHDIQYLQNTLTDSEEDGFQIWGIPEGAKSVLSSLQIGDYLLLLYTVGAGGSFHYLGRVIGIPAEPLPTLSKILWGEPKFSLIVFLRGGLVDYTWYQFCDDFGYKQNWNPAGMTSRLSEEKMEASPFGNDASFARALLGNEIKIREGTVRTDNVMFDDVEADIEDEEGRRQLRRHLKVERSSKLIKAFKSKLKHYKCEICGFDFQKRYGGIGKDYIEAHHKKPVSEMKPGEKTKLSDLVAVCSNCHRMLHRESPPYKPEYLKDIVDKNRNR